MRLVLAADLLLMSCLVAAAENRAQDKPATPAEQYQALLKEYQSAGLAFRNAQSDQERKLAVEHMDKFALRLADLAEEHSKDPVALDALLQFVRTINGVDSLTQTTWEMNRTAFPVKNKDNAASRAVAVLLRDHAKSDEIGLICERMRYGLRPEFETFLETVLETNPHKDIQGLACLALAELLTSRLQIIGLVEDRPELLTRYQDLVGKDAFDAWRRAGRAALTKKVEAVLERADTQYSDVKLPYGGTVGDKAKAELYAIRHLAVGKEALDIEGEDQDGKRFKLSDYRGKVVLLDFWSEY